jgi:hypothetical protein
MHQILEILDEAPESAGPDLVTLDDLKLALGITGVSEDAALEAAIAFQSRIIAEYCNRRFGRADAQETFTFNRGEVLNTWQAQARQALTLSLYPVAEISEVTSSGAITADYEFDPASGRVWVSGHTWSETWWQQATISVVYSGGYDLPEQAPARLSNAVIQAVSERRMSGNRDPLIREVQHGDTRIGYFSMATASVLPGFLSEPIMSLIKPYRRLHVA